MRANRTAAGFTLPEVLTSVVMVGMVLTLIYSVWSATINVTSTGATISQDIQRERMALKAITEVLGSATWYETRPEPQLQLETEDGFSQLTIISRVPPGFWGERTLGKHPLRRIEFRAEPNDTGGHRLVMLQQSLLGAQIRSGGTHEIEAQARDSWEYHRTVLLPHVETFALELKSPGTNSTWEAAWPEDPASSPVFPRQARVSLATSEAHPQQRTVPLFATVALHAPSVPVIGQVVPLSEISFAEDGFEVDESDAITRVVFIVDKSYSMKGSRLQMAKDSVIKSLSQMQDGQKFYVYFFDRNADAVGSAALEPTPENLSRISEWVKEQKSGFGDKGLWDAIKGGFAQEPTELHILTDGFTNRYDKDSDKATDLRTTIAQLNREKSVKVYTYGVGERVFGQESETTLMLIAHENGGTYYPLLPVQNISPSPAQNKK